MSNEDKFRELLKRMTVDLRTARNRVTELEERDHEPIAIVGVGCRYPGGANSPERLWEIVAAGDETLSDFPTDRGWDLDGLFDSDPDSPGTSYVRTGSFLHDAGEFDAAFFGISPREALAMDPQQRLALEVSWEAIERARIDPRTLHGTSTGVFLGIVGQNYGPSVIHADPGMDSYLGTGTMSAVAAGRIAYVLGLRGPAIPVETACSASLVAMHHAARSLRSGETNLALAGGVTIYNDPGAWVSFSRQRGLAPDGRCKAFGADADGTAWAEGIGILVLERLSDAQQNGRPILAVIRGSAVNQDGASSGMTAPNGLAQQDVIKDALHNARLTADQVDLVEAHGTGTSLGDPIEAAALLATYGKAHSPQDPLWLGSIKSNIAHASAAAGVAGVIKVTEAMRRGVMPRTLHADEPTPHVDWSSRTVALLTEARSWTKDDHPRRAGVSSFGVSGTNAHIILEEGPRSEPQFDAETEGQIPTPWVLSARTPAALRKRAHELATHIEANPQTRVADVAWSLTKTRTLFEHRAAVVGMAREELVEGLRALSDDKPSTVLVRGKARETGRTAFVFPGQGTQWVGMGERLLRESPEFSRRLHECSDALSPYVSYSVLDAVRTYDLDTLSRPKVLQPALFAVMVSLAALWEHHGIRPAAVVGHSQGEIAAACVAGILSLDDAARIVGLRSERVETLAGGNSMLALALPPGRTCPDLTQWQGALHIAAMNSPHAITVAGDDASLAQLRHQCMEEGIFAFPVPGSFAAHTPRVEHIRESLRDALAAIAPSEGHTPMYSSVTGTRIDGTQLGADYWYRNLRETVQFADAVRALADNGHKSFIECSPHAVLTMSVEQTLEDHRGADHGSAILGTLHADSGGLQRFLSAVAEFYVHGGEANWESTLAPHAPQAVDLPTYPFDRQHYWLTQRTQTSANELGLHAQRHGFLGAATSVAGDGGVVFTGRISRKSHPWLGDHAVKDSAILPGTGFLDLALHAAREVGATVVQELVLHTPLRLLADEAVQLQVRVSAPDAQGVAGVAIHSCPWQDDASHRGNVWTRHASGEVTISGESGADTTDLTQVPAGAIELPVDDLYKRLGDVGYTYGPAFRGLRAVWRHDSEIFAEVTLPPEAQKQDDRFGVHPALLDAAQHALVVARMDQSPDLSLPFAWSGVSLHATDASDVRVRITEQAEDSYSMSVTDRDGGIVLRVESLTVRPARVDDFEARTPSADDFFQVQWMPVPGGERPSTGSWAVLGDDELGIAGTLSAAGVNVDVYPDIAALRDAVAAGAPEPTTVILPCLSRKTGDVASDARELTTRTLLTVQEWLAYEEHTSRMVVLTWDAVAAKPEDRVSDVANAPLWGLVRTAQLEAPGQFVLVDVDDPRTAVPALPTVLNTDEPQLAIRQGSALVPRLSRAEDSLERPRRLPVDSTVLITGATGTIGGHATRHMVNQYGARNLVLASRSGHEASGAAELQSELAAAGAHISIVACDVSDRSALRAVIDDIPDDRPLRAVVHIAGTLDDGVLGAMTPKRVERVMSPKADGAIHLHELTQHLPIEQFVMFSSAASVFGSPGQANYAAASALLDALAHHRRAQGLAATSVSWGLWEERSQLTAKIGETSLQRHTRMGGKGALKSEHAMRLLDQAVATGAAHRAAAPLDLAGISRSAARGEPLVPMMRALVHVPQRLRRAGEATNDSSAFQQRLASATFEGRHEILLDLVRRQTAEVLGHPNSETVRSTDEFLELGYDSLTAVELRNNLAAVTGLRISAGLVFTHTTPDAVASHLDTLLGAKDRNGGSTDGAVTGSGDAVAPAGYAGQDTADPTGGLPTLFREFCHRGRIVDGFAVVRAASVLRETFASAAEFAGKLTPSRLAQGADERPVFICLPSILMISGVQEYARFAAGVRGVRNVEVIPQPGFLQGEPMPATILALVDVLTSSVRSTVGERPYVLVARSSGGWVAHAVAQQMEADGRPAQALGLLDPPSPDDDFALDLIESGLVEREQQLGIMDATRLTAMGGYLELFSGWMPDPIETPTVILRAEEATPDREGNLLPSFTWKPPHARVVVPGNHFSMLEEHVDQVARILHDWLVERGM